VTLQKIFATSKFSYQDNQQQVLGFAVLSINLSIMCKIAGPKPI
jgi:hypothetical protein